MKRLSLFEILKTALYVGAVGYGGPAIMALMKRVIVHEKRWISDDEFINALSLSQILPWAIGVTLLDSIGHKLKGGWGGILMPFAFAFAAMAAITVLAWAYFWYRIHSMSILCLDNMSPNVYTCVCGPATVSIDSLDKDKN